MPWTPARAALLEAVADEVQRDHGPGRAVIGIDGPDTAGKTIFAADLTAVLRRRALEVFQASIDDFHRPREVRHAAGSTSPIGYYRDAFDYPLFLDSLIEPFRQGSAGFVVAGFDLELDRPRATEPMTGGEGATLIVDGVFLQRPELRDVWDAVIYLHVDPAERDRRYVERDGIDPASELAGRYTGAQQIYLEQARPRESASIVIDNSDPDRPRRVG